MLNAATVAEWILSLVTTRERAAATVGDCLEDTRGAFAFWWFVLRTTFSLCARDAWKSRWRLLGLGVCGVVLEAFLAIVLVFLPMLIWISTVYVFRGADAAPQAISPWATAAIGSVMANAVAPFLAGRIVGRLSRGREMAAGLVLVMVPLAIASLTGALLTNAALTVFWREGGSLSFPGSYDILFVMAGALSWRARHPRAA